MSVWRLGAHFEVPLQVSHSRRRQTSWSASETNLTRFARQRG